jgi:hypothetical protein
MFGFPGRFQIKRSGSPLARFAVAMVAGVVTAVAMVREVGGDLIGKQRVEENEDALAVARRLLRTKASQRNSFYDVIAYPRAGIV